MRQEEALSLDVNKIFIIFEETFGIRKKNCIPCYICIMFRTVQPIVPKDVQDSRRQAFRHGIVIVTQKCCKEKTYREFRTIRKMQQTSIILGSRREGSYCKIERTKYDLG